MVPLNIAQPSLVAYDWELAYALISTAMFLGLWLGVVASKFILS